MRKERENSLKKVNLAIGGKDDIGSNDDEKNEKEALFCFMAFDNDINKVYDFSFPSSNDDNEKDDLYNELYDSLVKAKKDLKSKLAKNTMLHERI